MKYIEPVTSKFCIQQCILARQPSLKASFKDEDVLWSAPIIEQ